MNAMKVDGQCHCGDITYEATLNPERVSVCHCTDCEALGGSAFRTSVPVPVADFRLLSGAPTMYIKNADRGNRRAQAFCPRCGTPLYACDAEEPKALFRRFASMRQRASLPPTRQIWFRSALGWVMDIPHIMHTDRQ